ncbi:Serine/threonine phosphatase stp [Agrobacterium fabrum]|uniref:PP2C family protein-serine/threonine phosphatase n=1 Tax=Agrobacterium fabrum TaxID=1176649 RepID=UPI001DDCB644|nr:PP2C family serine/threonine-protein phosphatase [Agrobacterium fabrum]CAH0270187.1 Serine/threonine phosphatase stp [Agrobacterium fabrum]CAH0279524.1 Serine/threonine phosphatase stp [Agrobacterium fabrum]
MPSDTTKLSISAATHKGYSREGNEDSFLVDNHIGGGDCDQLSRELDIGEHGVVLAIADGLGGHKAGEVASRYAIVQILDRLAEVDFGNDAAVIDFLNSISHDLHQQMLVTPALFGMGTTIVMAVITTSSLTFINVGDSRGYLLDERGLQQTTRDDVPPNALSDTRRSGAITQALGGMSPRTRLMPHIHRTVIPAGDWSLILCSDGVSDFLSSEEIARIGRAGTSDAMTLVESSLRAGGHDNISAIVLRSSVREQTYTSVC